MAKIRRKGNRRIFVLAWTGEKYKKQEEILERYPYSGDATALVMEALRCYTDGGQSMARPAIPHNEDTSRCLSSEMIKGFKSRFSIE